MYKFEPELWNDSVTSEELVQKRGILGSARRKLAALSAASLLLLGGDARTSYYERQPITKQAQAADTLHLLRTNYQVAGFFEHIPLDQAFETQFECGDAAAENSHDRYTPGISIPSNGQVFFGINDTDDNGYLIDRDIIWVHSLKGGNYAATATNSAFSGQLDRYTYFDFTGQSKSLITIGRHVVAYWILDYTPGGIELSAQCA